MIKLGLKSKNYNLKWREEVFRNRKIIDLYAYHIVSNKKKINSKYMNLSLYSKRYVGGSKLWYVVPLRWFLSYVAPTSLISPDLSPHFPFPYGVFRFAKLDGRGRREPRCRRCRSNLPITREGSRRRRSPFVTLHRVAPVRRLPPS